MAQKKPSFHNFAFNVEELIFLFPNGHLLAGRLIDIVIYRPLCVYIVVFRNGC